MIAPVAPAIVGNPRLGRQSCTSKAENAAFGRYPVGQALDLVGQFRRSQQGLGVRGRCERRVCAQARRRTPMAVECHERSSRREKSAERHLGGDLHGEMPRIWSAPALF